MAVEHEDNLTACHIPLAPLLPEAWDPHSLCSSSHQEDCLPHDTELFLRSCESITFCPDPACGFFFEKWQDTTHQPTTVDEYFEEYRFRCRKCDKDFCSHCNQAPYHKGYTCEEYKTREESILCRFCERPLDAVDLENFPPTGDTANVDNYHCNNCWNYAVSCSSDLFPCGHASHFYDSLTPEASRTCMHPSCAGDGQTLEDFCGICGYESLRRYPLVRVDECRHVFHQICLEQRMSHRPNPVSLSQYCCSLCNTPVDNGVPEGVISDVRQLRSDLINRVPAQLVESQIDIGRKVEDKDYLVEALRKLNYYRCFKCHSIYFGGLRECGEQVELHEGDYVCSGCQSCAQHGSDQMIFKCRFCCSVAEFFCFGHTHFCTPCHNRAWELVSGANNAYLKEAVQPCPGIDKCPLKIAHAPNGEEFVLGCGACRDQEMSGVEFMPEPEPQPRNNYNFWNPDAGVAAFVFDRNPIVENPEQANDFAQRRNVVARGHAAANQFLPRVEQGDAFVVGKPVGGKIADLLRRLRQG